MAPPSRTNDELHAIHVRLKKQGKGGRASRFEIVKILAPALDVAVVQVRRVALDARWQAIKQDDDGSAAFSELAMYVLVRREGTWWLAAGHNTIVHPRAQG